MWQLFAGIMIIVVGSIIYFKFIKKKDEEVDIDVKPNTSGRAPIKKALLVGINKYKPELNADLRGCVNDTENVRGMLIKNFGFKPENIRVVIDERATKERMLQRLQWLLNDTVAGDELVFHYSGHGSQVRDRNGDELNDQLDEILCPHDLNWDDPFIDDILANLFKKVPAGVNLTMLCDSCHSGTVTRSFGNPVYHAPRVLRPPFDIKCRSLGQNIPKRKIGKKAKGSQRHVLLSGCMDNQTSADAYIHNTYQGAFTWAFTSVVKANPNITWREAHKKTLDKLVGYTQKPQLSGDDNLLDRKVFGGTV